LMEETQIYYGKIVEKIK